MNKAQQILLTNLAPMLRYNLADDGMGNLVVVSADAWACAHYHVHGVSLAMINGCELY